MFRSMIVAVAALCCVFGSASTSEAGFPKFKAPKVKVKSLGKYQQQTLAKGFGGAVGAGVAAATGNGFLGGAAGYAAGNHASKKWTSKGLQNWNKPGRW